MAQNMVQATAPTTLWPFKKSPTAIQTAAIAITNGHNVVVAISFEKATNFVYISYRISYVLLLHMCCSFLHLSCTGSCDTVSISNI